MMASMTTPHAAAVRNLRLAAPCTLALVMATAACTAAADEPVEFGVVADSTCADRHVEAPSERAQHGYDLTSVLSNDEGTGSEIHAASRATIGTQIRFDRRNSNRRLELTIPQEASVIGTEMAGTDPLYPEVITAADIEDLEWVVLRIVCEADYPGVVIKYSEY